MKAMRLAFVGLAGGLLAALAPATASAHGGDASLVHACVVNGVGLVRIVGPNQNCSFLETARHWSITGPQGPPGPQGPAGAAGPGQWTITIHSGTSAPGSATAVTCNIGGTTATTCDSGALNQAVAAGSYVTVRVTSTGTSAASARDWRFSFEY